MSIFKDNLDNYGNQATEARVGHDHWKGSPLHHLFNNRITSGNKHFANLANRFSTTQDSSWDHQLSEYVSCRASTGEIGMCSSGAICSNLGGRPSGHCHPTGVCCVSKYSL